MNGTWKECGECKESLVIETVFGEGYDCFVAFLTDKFVAGRAETLEQGLSGLEYEKLLELRLFSEEKEVVEAAA